MPRPESSFSLAQLMGDAVEVLDHVGAKQAHIVGNSAGGYVSQQLAVRHLARDSTLARFGSTPGLKHSHASSWVPRIKEMGLKQFLASTIVEVSAIKVPTQIAAAGEEQIGDASAYEEMRRLMEGAELGYYDTDSHNICDGYATQCVEDLVDFLQRCGEPASTDRETRCGS